MSKICYKPGPGNTTYELDIYRDMNLDLSTDCPTGWSDEAPTLECEGGESMITCYKCEGNLRHASKQCVGEQVKFSCGKGYDTYPIKCNYPTLADVGMGQPISYERKYCACQEYDGTVTGYSPLCCPQPSTPVSTTQPYTPQVTKAGFSNLPWFAWLLVAGGLIYWFNKAQDTKIIK